MSQTAQRSAAWTRRLGEHLPAICPGRAEHEGACRLPSNDGLTMEHMLESHFEQTVERCRAVRLAIPWLYDVRLEKTGRAIRQEISRYFGISNIRSEKPG